MIPPPEPPIDTRQRRDKCNTLNRYRTDGLGKLCRYQWLALWALILRRSAAAKRGLTPLVTYPTLVVDFFAAPSTNSPISRNFW